MHEPFRDGPPPWVRRGRGPWGPGGGRRFRRAGLGALLILVLLVATLASLVASALSGNPPPAGVTVAVAAVVVLGLLLVARWFWRTTRTVGALMDAADRVAGGDYTARVGDAGARHLGRLARSFDDMTERLQTNEARRRELLADVAHELRTPLQVIRGTLEGVLDGLYPADPAHLRPLLDETVLMARLLEDLRTLSMAEAGVLELHRESVDPRAIAEDAASAYRALAADDGVRLAAVAEPGVPALIEVDPVRLAEVLANLVGNAVRHTPRDGDVEIRVTGGNGGAVSFTVADTGPGIPADRLPYVFDRFVRSADTGGTGLGLAIAKRLVEAHGGTIEATSPAGGGTAIRFTIPAR